MIILFHVCLCLSTYLGRIYCLINNLTLDLDYSINDHLVSRMVDNAKYLFENEEVPYEEYFDLDGVRMENLKQRILSKHDHALKTRTRLMRKYKNTSHPAVTSPSVATEVLTNKDFLSPEPKFPMTGPPIDYVQKINLVDKQNLTMNEVDVEIPEIDSLKFTNFDSNSTRNEDVKDANLTCFACNNVENDFCNEPVQGITPEVICGIDDVKCYTQNTPFGIIERGCINLYKETLIYVCSCDLCNSIPLGEMPKVFENEEQWRANVIELFHTKRFRDSVFRDMSCLNCQVELAKLNDDKDYEKAIHCVEGNITEITTLKCKSNEICGVKVMRNIGYVWRGCLEKPIYNYYWTFCDENLCNINATFPKFD